MNDVVVLSSIAARVRGLLLAGRDAGTVLLVPCRDVHTFGMSYAIDVAFVDRSGYVVKAYRKVEPGCRLKCAGAVATLERPAAPAGKTASGWFYPGAFAGMSVKQAIEERIGR